ncbi:MAG: leucine-rich repeat domain-containing protein [Bacteroidota bacterium]
MIKTRIVTAAFLGLFVGITSPIHSQALEDPRTDEVRSLTKFFEYMLNIVGSSGGTQRDKDVIIQESFLKAFSNENVQVEDDLLDERKVITNKDVHAYLKDVDFFFQNINFKFDSIEISLKEKPNGEPFYLVNFESNMEGTTLEGTAFKKIQQRFLEINVNEITGDLKIVSVYTTKVSREKELRDWYSTLSFGWINVFNQYVAYDSITNNVLFEIADIDSINLSDNQFLSNISPLTALKNLRYINISNTRITDLSPIRYSTSIQTVIANNTPVKDLTPLKYFDAVIHLELKNSNVQEIGAVKDLVKLEMLDISETSVVDFSPLKPLDQLKSINLSGTAFTQLIFLSSAKNLRSINIARTNVTDLGPLSQLKQLEELNVSETNLLNLEGLEDHPSLKTIKINQTLVNSLKPIEHVKPLRKVEADLTYILSDSADNFMDRHFGVVVIVNSEELENWWDSLSAKWKSRFALFFEGDSPKKEDLIKISNIDSLDISDMKTNDLQPLQRLKKLRYLNVSNCSFDSFYFTKDLSALQGLVAENTPVKSAEGLKTNLKLSFINLKSSLIEDISSLYFLDKLSYVNLDLTSISKKKIKELILSNPDAVIIWQSEKLKNWWNGLNKNWKVALQLTSPTSQQLHQLTQSSSLEIRNVGIRSLSSLSVFIDLQELILDQVDILKFNGLTTHSGLKKLTCRNGPLQSLEGLNGLTQLQELDVSNTAIEDLEGLPITSLIKKLNCSGTNIKKLKGIEGITTIESIDISNTKIFKLDRLEGIQNLKELICYNTRLREFEVEKFQNMFPKCNVVFY